MAQTISTLSSKATTTKKSPGEQATKEVTNVRVIPEKWAQMFGIDVSLNEKAADENFITFITYSPPYLRYLTPLIGKNNGEAYDFTQSKPVGDPCGYKIWYPQDAIRESIEHKYGVGSTYDSAMNELREGFASFVNAPVSMVSGGRQAVIYDAPQMWTGSERRKFNITLDLFAYDNMDRDVYDVIRFFRKNSYPTRIGHKMNMVNMPPVFKITGGIFTQLQAGEAPFYTLTTMNVNYGDKVQFMRGGMPIQAKIELTFEECVLVMADMFEKEPVGVKVSYSGTTNKTKQGLKNISYDDAQQFIVDEILQKPVVGEDWNNGLGANDWDLGAKLDKPKVEGAAPVMKTAQSLVIDKIKGYAQNNTYYRLAGNFTDADKAMRFVKSAVVTKIYEIIQNSKLYKKVTAVIDIDPRHRVEIKSKLKAVKYAKWVT